MLDMFKAQSTTQELQGIWCASWRISSRISCKHVLQSIVPTPQYIICNLDNSCYLTTDDSMHS